MAAPLGKAGAGLVLAHHGRRRPESVGNHPRGPTSRPPPAPPPSSSYPDAVVRQPYGAPSRGPISLTAPGVAAQQDEINLPSEGTPGLSQPGAQQQYPGPYMGTPAYPPRERYSAPSPARPVTIPDLPQAERMPRLGPAQGNSVAAFGPVAVMPAATLACPIVSALDRWLAASLQPASQRWVGARVVEVRQVSAYSCRGMNGNALAPI